MRGNANAAKTPPAPTATAAQTAPPAPPPPISSPQTEIQLPPAQPVSPEALATIQTAPEPKPPEPPPEPPAKPATRRSTQTSAPKPDSPAPAVADTPALQPLPAPAEEQPRLQAFYTDEERRRILGEIEKRRGEIEGMLHGINLRRISANQKSAIGRIHSFMDVADDAAKRGDLRSADSLSQRALILAQELASGR